MESKKVRVDVAGSNESAEKLGGPRIKVQDFSLDLKDGVYNE